VKVFLRIGVNSITVSITRQYSTHLQENSIKSTNCSMQYWFRNCRQRSTRKVICVGPNDLGDHQNQHRKG